MRIFTNKDIRHLFIILAAVSGGWLLLIQLTVWLAGGLFSLALLLSVTALLGILGTCWLYFRRQDRLLAEAEGQIQRFLAGDTDARIDCDQEGSLYKLFHGVNTLATALSANGDKAQQGRRFLKSTIADISHQLKTPLAALNIYNGLLLEEAEDADAVRAFAAKSERELERIETLVQSLLKITRLDAGAIVITPGPESIADMMGDIRQYFEFRTVQEQKTIILSGPEDMLLSCDRGWLTEAVSNLVKNALDHTAAGGRIDISWQRLPAVTQITVRDNGSGIAQEDIHHIFKRFYRSRFSQDTQGLGLGLPLAKAIVEAHGGGITVDSLPGEGSVFVLSFVNLTEL